MKMSCHICGASETEPHFGGVSCSACAAFFRRYFHSKKSVASCTCQVRFRNSHPCRECRILKCLEAGMNPEKVQQKREKHPPKKRVLQEEVSMVASTSNNPYISSSPPSLPMSPLPLQIIPRDSSTIALTALSWQKVQNKRSLMFNKTLDQTNYYELSCIMREDCSMVWKIVEDLFPSATWNLRKLDKEALLRNFLPKWSVLTAAIDMEANVQRYSKFNNLEDCKRLIVNFYTDSIPNRYRMTPENILETFGPILAYYGQHVILPIHAKSLDKAEYMALALLILFDGAYTNISVECSEMCRNIRNLIYRELKGYQMDKNYDEMQFIDTLDTLSMVEKGERKFHEELLICDMHHVHLHDDYRYLRPLSSQKMTCLVCGSRQSEPHFGGNSCRACAAFFRRYFNSNKSVIVCICKTKKVNSHPCRSCRMAKCFAIGMTPLKIHGQRDPNGSSPRKLEKSISPLDLKFPTYTTHISPRHTSNISLSLPNFVEYEKKRWEIFQRPESIGLYKATSFTKQDFDITWEFVSESFPEFQKLLASDKKAMLNNFLIKIWNIEPVMDHVAERVKYEKMNEEEMMTVAFPMYDGSFLEGEEMGKDEIWRTFGVHWNRYFSLLIDPLITLALDKMEMMAVIWILFFDYAYINISQNCSDFSWNMRKVILQELKNYELEKNFTEEQAQSRFLEILEIPLIVERGEKQFHEEMILCELYKLRMHDDFRVMMKKQRI